MATRLALVAHARTSATSEARFPAGDDELEPGEPSQALVRRVAGVECGPETRCVRTAERLGLTPEPLAEWADLDVGTWSGFALEQVDGLGAWLQDADAAPHGGETVRALVARVDAALGRSRPDGLTVVVTSPAVVRAAVVAVLGAPAEAYARVDVAPLDALELNLNGPRRALRRLRPYPQWI